MSLITQCPACATMFRVVPDQLRISEGWVRCGQCDEVFDANAHLRNLEAPSAATEPEPPSAQQAPIAGADAPAVASEPEAAAPEQDAVPEPEPEPEPQFENEATLLMPLRAEGGAGYDWNTPPAAPYVAAELDFPPADAAQMPEAAVDPEPSLDHRDAAMLAPDAAPAEPAYAWQSDPLMEQRPQGRSLDAELQALSGFSVPDHVPQFDSPPADAFAAPQEVPVPSQPAVPGSEGLGDMALPSFMAATASPHPGRTRLARGLLLAACVLLGGLLGLQVLVQERDRLAASAPALRPVLEGVCEALACKVMPLRDIEAVAIDSSAFTSVRSGVYLLNVTLKNSAATALATPALELTLTDLQDKPLLRRVLLADAISDKQSLGSGAELSVSLPIEVQAAAVPEKISGYKVLAFYP